MMLKNISFLAVLLILAGGSLIQGSLSAAEAPHTAPLLWSTRDSVPANTFVAFRGTFNTPVRGEVEFQLSGASWYVIWLDGEYFYEGPDRYAAQYPEYQSKKAVLDKGNHLIAIEVHYEGVETRILDAIKPFLMCRLLQSGNVLPLSWRCRQLDGYERTGFRINAELGWVEWADTRKNPIEWQSAGFDDSLWGSPVRVERALGTFSLSKIGNVRNPEITPIELAEGKLVEIYGYEKDNPAARFFLRDLTAVKLPPQGIWKRYDLGRVRLLKPKFILDLPAGAVVEFAYSETLNNGRVTPWITLSASDSYNMDHFVARGGVQEFFPIHPKGGRYVEIHVLAPTDQIHFREEKFVERTYYDLPQGSFSSNDTLLNRIWMTGIETFRACSEDALIDNPTRERGEWIGDMGVGGMQIGSAGFSDIRICRRALVQSAQCAREDGMVAGLCPGGEAYLSSFAAQWVPACMNYYRLTGDKSILEELFPAAVKNMAAFQKYIGEWGVSNEAGWAFIDWGYVPNPEPADMALNLHYAMALQQMVRWADLTGHAASKKEYENQEAFIGKIIHSWFLKNSSGGKYDWDKIGYHRTVLGMLAGFIPQEQEGEAVAYIKKHILNCFPNNPDAPRLSDPGANNPQLITPYFSHFAFQVLFEYGESQFVLDQYRKCWGWALEDGRTTWTEVFDTRWSQCHEWSGSPTWQLSRYVLGLVPRFDRKANSFDLALCTGDLQSAEGHVPLPDGKLIRISWKILNGRIRYEIVTPEPITLHVPSQIHAAKKWPVTVKDRLDFSFPIH